MATKKKPVKIASKPAKKTAAKTKSVPAKKTVPSSKAKAKAKPETKAAPKPKAARSSDTKKTTSARSNSKASVATPSPSKKAAKPTTVTAKKSVPTKSEKTLSAAEETAPETQDILAKSAAKPKATKTTLDDLALDVDEKDQLVEEEKRDLIKALREDEDEPLETAFVPTDTSERFILVVDEEGQRRNETVSIVQQILPNAVVEVADDPDEALDIIQEADFDTYVVNFLMPGFSASAFVKSVANHPDHPLLIGFAADKISDALDQRKGLKIIPLKRLFDLEPSTDAAKDKSGGAED